MKFVILFMATFMSTLAFAQTSNSCLSKVAQGQKWFPISEGVATCMKGTTDFNSAIGFLCSKDGTALSAPYQKYLQYQDVYLKAYQKLHDATDPGTRSLAAAEMQAADQDWKGAGYKIETSEALNVLESSHYNCPEKPNVIEPSALGVQYMTGAQAFVAMTMSMKGVDIVGAKATPVKTISWRPMNKVGNQFLGDWQKIDMGGGYVMPDATFGMTLQFDKLMTPAVLKALNTVVIVMVVNDPPESPKNLLYFDIGLHCSSAPQDFMNIGTGESGCPAK